MKKEGENQDENVKDTKKWITKETIHAYFILLWTPR